MKIKKGVMSLEQAAELEMKFLRLLASGPLISTELPNDLFGSVLADAEEHGFAAASRTNDGWRWSLTDLGRSMINGNEANS